MDRCADFRDVLKNQSKVIISSSFQQPPTWKEDKWVITCYRLSISRQEGPASLLAALFINLACTTVHRGWNWTLPTVKQAIMLYMWKRPFWKMYAILKDVRHFGLGRNYDDIGLAVSNFILLSSKAQFWQMLLISPGLKGRKMFVYYITPSWLRPAGFRLWNNLITFRAFPTPICYAALEVKLGAVTVGWVCSLNLPAGANASMF